MVAMAFVLLIDPGSHTMKLHHCTVHLGPELGMNRPEHIAVLMQPDIIQLFKFLSRDQMCWRGPSPAEAAARGIHMWCTMLGWYY